MRSFKPIFLFFIIFIFTSSLRADFGNRFVANKRLWTALDSSAKKISFRFTCQENITLTDAAVYCVEAVAPPAYRVSIQEDQGGNPSSVPLSFSSYVPLRQSWSVVPLK